MKKILLINLFLFLSFTSYSQVKLGLNFSPGLAFSRLNYQVDPNRANITYKSQGVGLRFIAGPELSFYFGENYAFTTGAWYAIKRASISSDSIYNLQYLQLPATFKMFTNEIATDMKIYFQLGGTLDIKLAEKLKGQNFKTDSRFKPIDASLLIGSGVEMQMGENTYFLIGLRYTRGLINSIKSPDSNSIKIKNDIVSVDLGIRF